MRWSYLVLYLAGCGFHSPAGGAPDGPLPDGSGPGMLRFDAAGLKTGTRVEIAQPGSTSYTLLTDQNTTVSVPVGAGGWYPIHVGNGNSTGMSDLQFLHSDSASAPVPWTRDRLRARTSELNGVLRTVYGHQ